MLPWEGGCRCGELRVRVSQPPLLAAACHCTGCQKMSASAFSLTLVIPSAGFEVTAGEPAIGGTHHPAQHHHHCPRCKSWVFTRIAGFDQFVNLRATMLDDHAWFAPYAELWTREKLPWAETGARRSFETFPDMAGFQGLIEGYAADGARPSCPASR